MNKYLFSCIIIYFIYEFVTVECDYYSVLGVPRNAKERDIEKAFRKRAKKLHPDAKAGNAEKFAELSNAYEVLKDPEKRKKYDMFGEEGLKQEGPQGHSYQHYYGDGRQTFFTFEGFDFDDVFTNFGFGGGGRRGGRREQEFERVEPVSFEKTIVEEISPKNFQNTLKSIRVLNLYYFYMPASKPCIKVHKGFVETVTKFKGAVNVYAINCDKHESFCNSRVETMPTLIAHKHGSDRKIDYEEKDYTLKLEIWLHKIMPFELVEIEDRFQLEDFVENQKMTHVVAVVKKSLYLTLLKSMSVYLKNKVKIGFIRGSNRELSQYFKKRTETAMIYHMPELDSTDVKSIELTLENFSEVVLWLNLKQNEYKKKDLGVYRELTSELMASGECGPTDNQFCFIFIKYGNRLEYTLHKELPSISKKYVQDAVKIRYINATNQHKFVSAFGLSSRCPATEVCTKFVAYRGKRKRFKIMEKNLTPANIVKFIDDVITNLVPLNRNLLHDPRIIDYSNDEM